MEEPDGFALADEFMSIHGAATSGSKTVYGGLDGRRDQEMVVGVRESALHDGAAIEFPITYRTDCENRLVTEHQLRFGADALDAGPDAWQLLYPREVLAGVYVR